METTIFKDKIKIEAEKIGLKRFKNSFFKESEESIIFVIPRKSGYSKKYYLRVKTQIKPYSGDFIPEKYIKHDIGDIFLSLDDEDFEIFDLENEISDSVRLQRLETFFHINVKNWLDILSEKNKIIDLYKSGKLFLLPYTKNKIGV